MVSSIREKIWQVEKEKKRQRRLAKEQGHAVKERQEPENDQPEYTEVEVGEVSAEASNSDSVIDSGEIQAKINKPKKKAKKASKKT
tara:strand:+ start:427 stop:684 length:258 start_codon:yes stop_codon:yes gene_type:complete